MITYLDEREGVYKKLAKLSPEDAITQYSLALAASDSGDTKTAIAAYKAFLKLAPSDSQAPTARAALKQLEARRGDCRRERDQDHHHDQSSKSGSKRARSPVNGSRDEQRGRG